MTIAAWETLCDKELRQPFLEEKQLGPTGILGKNGAYKYGFSVFVFFR